MDLTNSIVIPENDLSCMLQQGEDETNTMIAGMLSLISDNEKLNEGLQNQSWCKRMFNTVIGKNKATVSEIRQNHDKLDAYIAQAVSMLYDRNRISSQIMVSLGLKINQLYNSHLELKGTLLTLASKLNEKIESVDNFHTLMEEIDEGVYGNEPSITALLSIISQIDGRMASDSKKIPLLERRLFSKNLLCKDNKFSIEDFLAQIADLQNDHLGMIYADLQLYRADYILISLAIDVIESWNLLAVPNRKLLKKQTIIGRIIREAGADGTAEIYLDEFYDEMVGLRRNLFNETKPLLTEPQNTVHDKKDNESTGSQYSQPTMENISESIRGKEKERGDVDAYVPTPAKKDDLPFLMPIESVFNFKDPFNFTYVFGRVERGVLKMNEEVEIVGLTDKCIKTVAVVQHDAKAGDEITVTLKGVHCGRGQVLAKPGSIRPRSRFQGQVYVLTKEEGGRRTPIFNNYRPQFRFRTADVTGVITLPKGTDLAMPGCTVMMNVELITPVAIEEGLHFTVLELGRTVGSGVVTAINS